MKPAQIASVVALTLATVVGAEVVISRVTANTQAGCEKTAQQVPPSTTTSEPRAASIPVDATRPPVPIKINHKTPIASDAVKAADAGPGPPTGPTTDKAATLAEQTAGAPPETAAAAAPSESEKAAKAAIEADGYKGVQMLSQGGNGMWKASALRGKTRIVVNVDPAGNVSAE